MISRIRLVLFFIFLTLLLFTSGWGIPQGNMLSLHLIQIIPFLLFGTFLLKKEKIYLPRFITVVFILFSIAVSLSTLFAQNVEYAFEYQLYYISVFLLFLYVYNEKNTIKRYFLYFVKLSTIATILYSLFLQVFLPEKLSFLIPSGSSQLVYKFEGYLNHHPLGAFILLPLAVLFIYTLYNQKLSHILGLISLFMLLILSNLRSAYIGFISVIFTSFYFDPKKLLNRKLLTICIGFVFFIIFALLINSRLGIKIPVISDVNQFLIDQGVFTVARQFFNIRDEYYVQALEAIKDRPILGFGASNFYYASMLHTPSIDALANNAHSLFLNIAVENGIVGVLLFLIIILLIVKSIPRIFKNGSIEEKSIAAVFIALLILFQLNFYSRIYYLFIIFFVCGATIYEEKEKIKDKYIVVFLSGLIAIISLVILSAKIILLNGNSLLALRIYPIYAEAYKVQLWKSYEIGNFNQVNTLLNNYSNIFSQEPEQLTNIGDMYLEIKDYKKALSVYKQALNLFPLETGLIIRVYEAYSKLGASQNGEEYVRNHITKYTVLKRNRFSNDNQFMITWFKQYEIEL